MVIRKVGVRLNNGEMKMAWTRDEAALFGINGGHSFFILKKTLS